MLTTQRRQKIYDRLKKKGAIESPPPATPPGLNPRLYFAVSRGKREDAKVLLVNGADPNWRNEDDGGQTALLCSVIAKDVEMVKLLVDKGANPEAKSGKGQTPLSYAKVEGLEEILKLLDSAKDELENRRSQQELL